MDSKNSETCPDCKGAGSGIERHPFEDDRHVGCERCRGTGVLRAAPTGEPAQEQLDAFIARAGFTYGWRNLESWARRMAEQAVTELATPPAPAVNSALRDLLDNAIRELQWPGEQRVARAAAMLHMALGLVDAVLARDTTAIQAAVPYGAPAAPQFDGKEIALLAIAMTTAGLAQYGQRPAPVTMETLVRHEHAMRALTAKVIDMMTVAAVDVVAG